MLDVLLVLVIVAILMAQQAKVELQLPVPRDSLVPHLAAVFKPRPEKILFIDGARDARYQDVFHAYGAVRGAGVTVTAILPAGSRRPD